MFKLNLFIIFSIVYISILTFIGILFELPQGMIHAIILLSIFIAGAGFTYRNYKTFKYNKNLFVIITIGLLSITNYIFHDYSLDGNDYTVVAVTAKQYSQHNSFYFDDDSILGNYSGFYDTETGIISQFLPLYPSFLSFFYSFLSIHGLFLGNSLLYFSILLSLFLIIFNITRSHLLSYFGIFFISTSFIYIYFFQKTATEIYLFFTFISFVLFLIHYFDRQKTIDLLLSGGMISLGIFVKLEIIPFIFLSLIGVKYIIDGNKENRNVLFLYLIPILSILILFYVFSIYTNNPYIGHNINIIFNKLGNPFTIFLILIVGFFAIYFLNFKKIIDKIIGHIKNIFIGKTTYFIVLLIILFLLVLEGYGFLSRTEYGLIFSINMLKNYGLFIYLLFGIAGLCIFLSQKNYNKKILILIILYSFGLYFMHQPGIGWTQPWFTRRFLVFTIPFLLILSIYSLTFIKNKFILYLTISVLCINNIIFSISIFTLNENKSLYNSVLMLDNNYKNTLFIMENGRTWQKEIGYIGNFFTVNGNKYVINTENIDTSKFQDIIYISKRLDYTKNLIYAHNITNNTLTKPCWITGYIDTYASNISTQHIKRLCYWINNKHKIEIKQYSLYFYTN